MFLGDEPSVCLIQKLINQMSCLAAVVAWGTVRGFLSFGVTPDAECWAELN